MQNSVLMTTLTLNDLKEVVIECVSSCLKYQAQNPNNPSIENPERYEQGVKVAMEELNWKEQTVYQNIDKLPKKKLHGKLYFNRQELQEYIRNEGKK